MDATQKLIVRLTKQELFDLIAKDDPTLFKGKDYTMVDQVTEDSTDASKIIITFVEETA